MIHIICIITSACAALMPGTAWPDMLNLLAGGMAVCAGLTLLIFNAAVDRATDVPDPRLHFPAWAAILVAASMVHWLPLTCFVFVFLVETAFYSRVQEKQDD